jgi:hypothetical protein
MSTTTIRESVRQSSQMRVDRQKGEIRNVHIPGWISLNNRT